jgi:dTDP-4-dehydrorhamnose reductase
MKIAVTGAMGLFGRGLVQILSARHTVVALSHAEADITQAESIRSLFEKLHPDVIVHPAGIPDLDISEADPARAFLVNVHGTRNVVEAARKVGAAVAYVSSDTVFDGKARAPYTESDPAKPPTVYGRTKLLAERAAQTLPAHWIFRVSVLFGPGKTNFIEKGLRALAASKPYVVAADQLGSATYTLDAAEKILEVVEARRFGLYHLSNQGACTRMDLALHAAKIAGLDASEVVGKPSAEVGRRAVRLSYAVMEMKALTLAGFAMPRPWQEAASDYVRSLSWVKEKSAESAR